MWCPTCSFEEIGTPSNEAEIFEVSKCSECLANYFINQQGDTIYL